MSPLTPPEKASLLVSESIFKLRRDFPVLSVGECAALLAQYGLVEAGNCAGHPKSPATASAELAYRMADLFVAATAGAPETGERA